MLPLQPPDAAQFLALLALHCSVTGVPMVTALSLAFKVTKGGAATAGVAALPVGVLLGVVLVVVAPLGVAVPDGMPVVDVSAFELSPHAASALSALNPRISFNANANLEQRLRRIELITRLPKNYCENFFRGTRIRSSAIIGITYSFDILKSPTCRHLQTTYVQRRENSLSRIANEKNLAQKSFVAHWRHVLGSVER
jgi:hypothetical protein